MPCTNAGVHINTRMDGKVFNLTRLKAKTKVREVCVKELLFADDTALAALSDTEAQELTTNFAIASSRFGLAINAAKTKIIFQPAPDSNQSDPKITINETELKTVTKFTYLGSTVNKQNSLEDEINHRLKAASSAYGALYKRVWSQKSLTTETKCKVYRSLVLSSLLYSAETYTLYRHHINKLTGVQMRHLRKIMNISWKDKITNAEVLKRAKMPSVEAILTGVQLRWAGHVVRMDNSRLPKVIFYGELKQGTRPIGRPKLRYRDVIKRHLITTGLDVDNWEAAANDRIKWRTEIKRGMNVVDVQRASRAAEKRRKFHDSQIT